jgi:hypothetical protein
MEESRRDLCLSRLLLAGEERAGQTLIRSLRSSLVRLAREKWFDEFDEEDRTDSLAF